MFVLLLLLFSCSENLWLVVACLVSALCEGALVTFLAPSQAIADTVIVQYKERIVNIARRFFHLYGILCFEVRIQRRKSTNDSQGRTTKDDKVCIYRTGHAVYVPVCFRSLSCYFFAYS